MKIVHVITRLIVGGAQENTLITCRLLAEHGHDVTLITGPAIGPEGHLFDDAENEGYEVIVIDRMRREIHPRYDWSVYRQLKTIFAEMGPDIVHTHSAKAGILARYAAAAVRKRSKQHKPEIVHTIHGLAFHPYLSNHLNRFYIAVEKAAAKRTDAFISVADTMTEKALAAGIGKPDIFTTAYSAIEEDAYLAPADEQKISDFRRKHGISDNAVVLVTIARLAELKGHEYIIESAKRLAQKYPNCMWLLVGNGNLADKIKQEIQMANLRHRFCFTGLIHPTEIPMAIHASDILVHCSLREGLARALPQAMLAGKPVVSFDIDGAKEVVNENTGRLIVPEDVDALTEACDELICDKELRCTLGKTARESVKRKFAPETMVGTIEKVYRRLIPEYHA